MKKHNAETIIRQLLALADISVNGARPFDIQVKNDALYSRILNDQALGVGESYMDGWWEIEALDQFIDKILRAKLDKIIRGSWKIKWHILRSKLFNLQSAARAFQVGRQHYDRGNELYEAMLDKRMNYSCAYWKNAKTLDDAQEAKLDLICKKLNLNEGMSVLDIGCGFGGFSKFAAEKYKVRVTGVSVSKNQVELARRRSASLGVKIELMDYRKIEGNFDRILSIGFMEHVGYRNYRTYMETVNRLLKKDGIALIHTIGQNESATTCNAWTDKYIFPNGLVPSLEQLSKAMEGLFVIEDIHNFGPDYDRTLMAWYRNFENAWEALKKKYDEHFRRMWRYYLLSSAGGFRCRNNQLWQIVMTKPGQPQPACRFGCVS